jgi:phosphoribosylanthranilate isomerase
MLKVTCWATTPLKKVKVCGLTRAQDVTLAAELGANLAGFVLAPSPRSVTVEQLEELVSYAPASVLTVAVTVNPSRKLADRLLEVADRIQFHGDESPDFCARYGRRSIKAFRIRSVADLERVEAYEKSVGAYLLDSFKEGQAGGTGESFCWGYLEGREFSLPTFLAGGLNPKNAADAHRLPQIAGVDVSSGLEKSPGVKDPKLMQEFFATFRK